MRVYWFYSSQGWSFQTSGPKTSGYSSFQWKSKVLVPFLNDEKTGGHLFPSHVNSPPPKRSGKNIKIVVYCSLVDRPNNYAFGDDKTLNSPWRKCPYSWHIVFVIGKNMETFLINFLKGGEFCTRRIFCEEKISRGIFQEKCHMRGESEILAWLE